MGPIRGWNISGEYCKVPVKGGDTLAVGERLRSWFGDRSFMSSVDSGVFISPRTCNEIAEKVPAVIRQTEDIFKTDLACS